MAEIPVPNCWFCRGNLAFSSIHLQSKETERPVITECCHAYHDSCLRFYLRDETVRSCVAKGCLEAVDLEHRTDVRFQTTAYRLTATPALEPDSETISSALEAQATEIGELKKKNENLIAKIENLQKEIDLSKVFNSRLVDIINKDHSRSFEARNSVVKTNVGIPPGIATCGPPGIPAPHTQRQSPPPPPPPQQPMLGVVSTLRPPTYQQMYVSPPSVPAPRTQRQSPPPPPPPQQPMLGAVSTLRPPIYQQMCVSPLVKPATAVAASSNVQFATHRMSPEPLQEHHDRVKRITRMAQERSQAIPREHPPQSRGDNYMPASKRLKYLHYETTGEDARGFAVVEFDSETLFASDNYLLLGDGMVTGVLRSAVAGGELTDRLNNSRFYGERITLWKLADLIKSLPYLPDKVILSCGDVDTSSKLRTADQVLSAVQELFAALHAKGVREIAVAPPIMHAEQYPVREDLEAILRNPPKEGLNWNYEYLIEVFEVTSRVRKTEKRGKTHLYTSRDFREIGRIIQQYTQRRSQLN